MVSRATIRAFAVVALVAALLALAARAGAVLLAAAGTLSFPASLDYGEGIVLQQALLVTGPQAYGDITRYPFIVFHYPPGYLLAVRAIAALGWDITVAGRLVSLAATVAVAICVALAVWRGLAGVAPSWARLYGSAAGGLVLFAWTPVADWSGLARVDMLALALTAAGLLAGLQAMGRPRIAILAAGLFTLAVFTRQTALAAPAATAIVLALASPRDAVRFVVWGLVFATTILAGASWLTDGGFLRHVVGYNVNRFDPDGATHLAAFLISHALLVMLAVSGTLEGLRRLDLRREAGEGRLGSVLRSSIGRRAFLTALLYLAISTPLLATIFKSGASVNYFLEWAAAASLLIGLLLGWAAATVAGTGTARGNLTPVSALVLAVLVPIQIARLPGPESGFGSAAARAVALDLIDEVKRADRPVMSSDMVLLVAAGRDVPWEPAIFTELAAMDRWDEHPLVEMIRDGRFAFVLTYPDDNLTPAVRAAIRAAFPREVRRGWMIQHLPAAPG